MKKLDELRASFRVGDSVRVPLGTQKVDARIIEDRGRVGAGGRRLFVVEIPLDPLDSMTFELPETEIERGSDEDQRIDEAKLIDYLRNGGLIAILRSNIAGGRSQPKVWLRLDTLGNVTHTFSEGRGVRGGRTVPFWATDGESVFLEKVEEVKEYLASLGLRPEQAEDVIRAVGTSPP